ncbi:arf-GAP domain and FG repeat-containing protein 1 isoform X10 [Protopterus annectens]|uniref:arf-GAP domain and FG repeat-containing protein 1 isoform X10 n=1 Tax=Protopterus annectens TaxID=7888 RepID=UPI001CFA0AE9|nr:arf-GAP domain and FG repeat-containing protein 1 isoform X10 [Protopterus annectens]
MAASAKRKQEEKHLKMLREMTSLPHNRKCFDCDQRGPTYANMTVGSFVCTSCSGILRGLNPPHRVKSISMTTFTQQEIEFLQKHGNEICKQIWLGLYDERSSSIPDFRDPQKVKEFLQEKYEKKRWYVPPEQAKVVATVHASISGSSASSTSSTPEVKPLKTLLGDTAPALQLNKSTPNQSPVSGRSQDQQQQPQQQPEKKSFDLLSDLGGDIFAAPAPPQSTHFANFAQFNSYTAQNNADFANFDAFGNSSTSINFGAGFPTAGQTAFQPQNTGGSSGSANANFAHFDNFHKSSSADFGAFSSSQSSVAATTASKAVVNTPSVPSVDKYASLADLDSVFSAVKTGQGTTGQMSNFNAATVTASSAPVPSGSAAGQLGSSDKYAALAALDNVFGTTVPSSSAFSSTTSTVSSVFGATPGAGASQTQSIASSAGAAAAFGVAANTNPFMSASVTPGGMPTNPFQSNGRTAAAATFGTASLSMPAGFGPSATYNLPTSFSGTFQQPAFPSQTAFPQQPAYPQQPNGATFAAFGQAKPVVTPFGTMAAPQMTSNPFMATAPTGQFPAGGSSTNPFL